MSATTPTSKGKMLLVGAGPGDPELLTLKAYRALQQADLVLADRLVPPEILAIIAGEIRVARKCYGKADVAQTELNAWGLEALTQNKLVVRLKNGDPFVYGRGGEEAVIYSEAGFIVEVIPGISCSLSAPASAGIPATMRDVADQVLICTGHGKKDRFPDLPEYCAHRTTIFLMVIGRIEWLTQMLQNERQFPGDMPAAIIHAATTSNACTIRSTLREIASLVRHHGITPPGTLVLGNAVNALTFLKNYDAVKDVDVVLDRVPSSKTLSRIPKSNLGEYIRLKATTRHLEMLGSEILNVNVVVVLLALFSLLFSVVAISSA